MLKIWEPDNFRRTLAGLCCFAAPMALLLAFLVHPGAAPEDLVATVAAEPGRIQASALLTLLTALLFVPALIGVLRVLRHRGVVLGHLAVALSIIGVIGHAVFAGFQIILSFALESGVDEAALASMVEGTPSIGFVVVLLTFLVGFLLGMLLLAAALWRSRSVPVWVPFGLVALVVADLAPVPGGRITASLVLAVGVVCFGAVGLVLLRMTDQEWRYGEPDVEARLHPVEQVVA